MKLPKYRAWDHDDKKMWKVVAMSESIYGDCEDSYIKVCEFDKSPRDKETNIRLSFNFQLMQFTGLYDKNDKEIYEGDIVKNVGPHTPRIFTSGLGEFEYLDDILVVCREEVGFTLRTIEDFLRNRVSESCFYGFAPNGWYGKKPPVDNYQFWNFQRSFEVIGNIYENPELLEESK